MLTENSKCQIILFARVNLSISDALQTPVVSDGPVSRLHQPYISLSYSLFQVHDFKYF